MGNKKTHRNVCPYLFKYFTGGLNLILSTQYISGAEAVGFSKALHGMFEQLIQCVLSWKVLTGQGIEVVHRAVRSLCAACGGASLYPLGLSFSLPGTCDVVPGHEGQDGVQPYQKVDW